MTSVINEKEKILTGRMQILDECMRFYKELHSKNIEITEENNKCNETSAVDKISKEDILNVLKKRKRKKPQRKMVLLQ